MITSTITDRKGLIIKLKLMAEEYKILENKKEYLILMNTIQMIEELIYLNNCYIEDLEKLFKDCQENRKQWVASMDIVMDEGD
jgi:hypothetical protein